jgi:hypothetical protein
MSSWQARVLNAPAAMVLRRRLWPVIAPAGLTWADDSLRHLRRTLPVDGVEARLGIPPRSRLPLDAILPRWLEWRGATCLERSLILQRWLLEVGRPHDLLIGVQRRGGSVIAHAWLDHEDPRGYAELLRLQPSRDGTTVPKGFSAESWV